MYSVSQGGSRGVLVRGGGGAGGRGGGMGVWRCGGAGVLLLLPLGLVGRQVGITSYPGANLWEGESLKLECRCVKLIFFQDSFVT